MNTVENASNHILEIKNLKKIYHQDLFSKSKLALNGLTCGFPQGKCTGFMGHNGAGKTSTIRIIFNLIKADQGEILFKGSPIKQSDRFIIGYMPETNKLALTLTPNEILDYQLKVCSRIGLTSKERTTTIKDKLEEVGLWESRKTQTRFLSKGMGRRLAWAQATIHKPELIILDEPFSGMDPKCRELMVEWLDTFRKQGRSIILCSHELSTVVGLCDEVHIVNNGALVYSSIHEIAGTQPPVMPSQVYGLHIVGSAEQELKEFAKKHALPAWIQHDTTGYLVKLRFTTYTDAAKWMDFCLGKGFVIPYFGEEKKFSYEQLLRYF